MVVPHLSDNQLAQTGEATTIEVRGIDVLPKILGPLMGGEEIDIDDMDILPSSLQFQREDKQREQDGVLRLTCVEILLLLCTCEFFFGGEGGLLLGFHQPGSQSSFFF